MNERAQAVTSLSMMVWLSLALASALLPHLAHVPWWLGTLVIVFIGWRLYLVWSGRPLPHKSLLLVLVIVGCIATSLQYRTWFGRDAGVALVVLFVGLKMLEIRTRRDVVIVIVLLYFVSLTNFFYSQSIATAAATMVTVLLATAAMAASTHGAMAARPRLRMAAIMLLQALPLGLVMFVLFPRIQGPLWGLPQDAYSGISGLSDTMAPGTITRLSLSDAIAFRAKFDGPAPRSASLYWRGPVLWDFDGRMWTAGAAKPHYDVKFSLHGTPVDYLVTLEPHNKQWLFALELAAKVPPGAAVTVDQQWA